jgi:chemotaxis regulatin CheY-phosphate phosphatase CheZ
MAEQASDGAAPSPGAKPAAALAEHYAALEAALKATPRGRWFLAEYARRNRAAETDMLLEAVARLEAAVLRPQRQPAPTDVLAELKALSEAIANTRREIARIKPPHHVDKDIVSATEELDCIVEATERATSEILEAAEDIQEVAWTMREKSVELGLCDKIDRRATDIYTACSFQDITGQRTEKVVKALRFIEQRINAMIEIWGVDDIAFKVDDIAAKMKAFADVAVRDDDRLLHGPQLRGEGLKQADVDRMLKGRDGLARAAAAIASASLEQGAEPLGASASQPSLSERPAFERPQALSVAELDAVKRAALFG